MILGGDGVTGTHNRGIGGAGLKEHGAGALDKYSMPSWVASFFSIVCRHINHIVRSSYSDLVGSTRFSDPRHTAVCASSICTSETVSRKIYLLMLLTVAVDPGTAILNTSSRGLFGRSFVVRL